MKHLFLLGSLCLAMMLSSCIVNPRLTEAYLKTQLESHEVGERSTFKTYRLFKGSTANWGGHLELLAYQYQGGKPLLIAGGKSKRARRNLRKEPGTEEELHYALLSPEQCEAIIAQRKILLQQFEGEKLKLRERRYHDYAVSDDLTISFKAASANSPGETIHLWIQGEKYPMRTSTFIEKLYLFLKS